MSTRKITTEDVEIGSMVADRDSTSADTVPNKRLELLSLELEEDVGGDPYNRTGQFCVIDLKNREQ